MADASLAITTEYVKCFLALFGTGIYWPEKVLRALAGDNLETLDVMYVLTHGDVVESEKETADGATMTMIGQTCDDVQIRVTFWSDINQMDFRILAVTRI